MVRSRMVVDYFLKWVKTARAADRAAAAAALADAYCRSRLPLDDYCAAEAAMTVLLDDPSSRVRRALADVLSLSRRAPLPILAALAKDQPDVAAPVIARSPLLGEGQLLDLVANGSEGVRKLVADRAEVSAAVCAALAELAGAEACLVLSRNPSAELTPAAFRNMVERHGGDPSLREALAAHPALPTECRHMLLVRVGEALRSSRFLTAVMGEEHTGRAVRDACRKSSITLLEGAPSSDHASLVNHLRERGELTAGFVVSAVAYGRIDFFGAVLVALTDQAFARIRGVLAHGNDGALQALFRKAGLAQAIHGVILRALKIWRDVALSRRLAGPQEVTFMMLQELGGEKATGDLAALIRSIHLETSRANARSHALALAAA